MIKFRTIRGVTLSSVELALYKEVRRCMRHSYYWQVEERKARDALIVLLQPFMTYPIKRIAALLNVSKYRIAKDMKRLQDEYLEDLWEEVEDNEEVRKIRRVI